jgi:septal ring factor EnvC (AmiA/AmiB activator)
MVMQGSEQLREMTAVLEEFDEKYSRKEKQLEASRRQTDQIKEAFEGLKQLQNQTTGQLKRTEEELLLMQSECRKKL